MLKTVIIIVALTAALFALYFFGFITLSVKRSLMYIASNLGDHARFRSCHGYTRRILHFHEDKVLSVTLSAALSAGAVTVDITGGTQRLHLDAEHPSGTLAVQPGIRYTQTVRFSNATGEYTISKA